MTVALQALPQFFDNAGNPLSNGKLFTYQAGTLTPLATYTDRDGGTPNSNPVILDAAGRADVWLSTNVAYKLRLEDSGGNVLDTIDDFYAGADPAQLSAAGIVPATGGTYTGAVTFEGGATFSGTPAQDLATLDSLSIASVKNANLWINSDAAIWQRQIASVADGAYGFDQFINLCETGSNTLSQVAQPTDGIPFAMRITQPDVTAKRVGFAQIVEAKNCLAYRGKNLVFALKVRASIATTVRCALVAWTGTADAPTRDVVNNWASTNYTAGNFFVANTQTIATAATAVSAATWTDLVVSSTSAGGVVAPSSMTNLYMVVWTDAAVAQNVTIDASALRCGQGTTAPLWTPPDAQTELAKCQRYLPVIGPTAAGVNGILGSGQCINTTTAVIPLNFKVSTRVPVTGLVSVNPTYFQVANAAYVGATTSAIALYGTASTDTAGISVTTTGAALVAGDATTFVSVLAGGQLIFTGAEL